MYRESVAMHQSITVAPARILKPSRSSAACDCASITLNLPASVPTTLLQAPQGQLEADLAAKAVAFSLVCKFTRLNKCVEKVVLQSLAVVAVPTHAARVGDNKLVAVLWPWYATDKVNRVRVMLAL